MTDRRANSREFWLATCGFDTHIRGSHYARHITPWNAFGQNKHRLVCTLWSDTIIEVLDPATRRTRRFTMLGGLSKDWKGPAVEKGQSAWSNLLLALDNDIPIHAYEAEPDANALTRGGRKLGHLRLDRVHQLECRNRVEMQDPELLLRIQTAFKRSQIEVNAKRHAPPLLFELVTPTSHEDGTLKAKEEIDGKHLEGDDAHISSVADPLAIRALAILVQHVAEQRDGVLVPMTYPQLAQRLSRLTRHGEPHVRGLAFALERVQMLIEQATRQWPEHVPILTSIVVFPCGPNRGLPGDASQARWQQFASLSRQDKEARVREEYARILHLGSRWNDILALARILGQTPESAHSEDRPPRHGGRSGAESEAHKALKQYVLDNPGRFGVPHDYTFGATEFVLRSGDIIDVMFRSKKRWIGVEVKSRVSDAHHDDYDRGIYQAVKYRAVLEAQATVEHPDCPPQVQVLLVLERRMPAERVALAKTLGVQYVENVTPETLTSFRVA